MHRLTGAMPNKFASLGAAGLQPLSAKQQQRYNHGGYWDKPAPARELLPIVARATGDACMKINSAKYMPVDSGAERSTSPESPPSSPRDLPCSRPTSSASTSSVSSTATSENTESHDGRGFEDKEDVHNEELQRIWKRLGEGKTNKIKLKLQQKGLDPSTDPRLAAVNDALSDVDSTNGHMSSAQFRQLVKSNAVIERAFLGKLVIPDFHAFSKEMERMKIDTEMNTGGEPASYIPQLAMVDPDQYGVSVCTIDGQRFGCGASNVSFCVQSTMKPLAYAMVLEELGEAKVHQHVGREPSGLNFNELVLNPKDLPHNPMINAGAIMVSALLRPDLAMSDRWDVVMSTWKRLSNRDPGFANSVYLSESSTADRNWCLGHIMKEAKAFPPGVDLKEALEFYFMMCSINVDTDMMAMIAATLANGGVNPHTGDSVFSARTVRNTLSLMASCGMYDYSGAFAFDVGMPCKSGVGGSVMVVIPGVMGLCTFSPSLDPLGNSVRGQDFCYSLVSKYPFHMLERNLYVGQLSDPWSTVGLADNRDAKADPRAARKLDMAQFQADLVALRNAAIRGELVWLRQIVSRGVAIDYRDFDGRTALHGAAFNGHTSCVQYLLALDADLSIRDHFGNTVLDDAISQQHSSCIDALTQAGRTLKGEETAAVGALPQVRKRANLMYASTAESLKLCFRHLQAGQQSFDSCSCTVSHFIHCCNAGGIRADDPRLAQILLKLPEPSFSVEHFVAAMTKAKPSEQDLVLRTLTGRLTIPAFAEFEKEFQTMCTTVHKDATAEGTSDLLSGNNKAAAGQTKSTVANVDFAVVVCTVTGQHCAYGDVDSEEIAIGEVSAALNYCLIHDHTDTNVHEHIGREPSGRGTKDLLLNSKNQPHNPLVGAGALLACSLIIQNKPAIQQRQEEYHQQHTSTLSAAAEVSDTKNDTQPRKLSESVYELVQKMYSESAGAAKLNVDEKMFQTLKEGGREAAGVFCLAYLLLDRGCFPTNSTAEDVRNTLDLLFRCEATSMTCRALATLAATLANAGVCPMTCKRVFSAQAVRNCLAIMFSCGQGDASGDYSFHIGTPSISSSTGCTLVVVPGVTGFCIWSPEQDSVGTVGNSVRAMAFSSMLVSRWPQVHVFEPQDDQVNSFSRPGSNSLGQIDPIQHPANNLVERAVFSVLSAAARGDTEDVCRLKNEHGVELLLAADGNGRTPLHCAASNGQASVARYILSELNAADGSCRKSIAALSCHDRWGHTPTDIVSVHNGTAPAGWRRPSKQLTDLFEANGSAVGSA